MYWLTKYKFDTRRACPCRRELLIKVSAWGRTLFLTVRPTFGPDLLSAINVQHNSRARAAICKSESLKSNTKIQHLKMSTELLTLYNSNYMGKPHLWYLIRVESSTTMTSYAAEPILSPYPTINVFSVPRVACLSARLAYLVGNMKSAQKFSISNHQGIKVEKFS